MQHTHNVSMYALKLNSEIGQIYEILTQNMFFKS